MKIVDPKWISEIKEKLRVGHEVDETIKSNLVASWLIAFLARRNTPFKVYNLGAGVKRVTTDTDICPMCKRKLMEK